MHSHKLYHYENKPRIYKSIATVALIICIFSLFSCKKLVDIAPPISSITTKQVFSNDGQATAAMSGVYYNLVNTTNPILTSGGITIYGGLSADELLPFNTGNLDDNQFYINGLDATNVANGLYLWTTAFNALYNTNAVLEGLSEATNVHDSVKSELEGEAKFVRAFLNFYLVNLYGDIPLVETTNWHNTSILRRSSTDEVYASIISDLVAAQGVLPDDYRSSKNQRIVPNKLCATALLARVYLYKGDWSKAEELSSLVINNTLYHLEDDLNTVFTPLSQEVIWQLQQDSSSFTYNATTEGALIIPFDNASQPYVYLSDSLLNAFDSGDYRKKYWIDSTVYSGQTYYFPNKYRIGLSTATPNGSIPQYYVALRLVEQYLIRAEARAQIGSNLEGAAADINIVRARSGLKNTAADTQSDLLFAIENERRTELFTEWGHRWLDLKRSGHGETTLSAVKNITVGKNALLFPIPTSELRTDPQLTQNNGY